ncbi:MAG: cytochrome-c peroxidase, partial [Chitinophagales bacterium]|nr:cytochrome-c peroxidase [Chitinophagales bacterium]
MGFAAILFMQCEHDPLIDDDGLVYDPKPYNFDKLPLGLPNAIFLNNIPIDNPTTEEGVALGRKLFYDPILSADSTLSCAGCHNQSFGFTDENQQFSIGIDGIAGSRNAMPIFNLGYQPATYSIPPYDTIGFFWDGRSPTLEAQVLRPIQDSVEMHETLPKILEKLNRHEEYANMFYEAFGTKEITPDLLGKAIAQFERIIVSGNTKYDKATNVVPGVYLSELELKGDSLFKALDGGDCFHCHIVGGAFTDYTYRNNGLDDAYVYTDFEDPGLGAFT